MYTWLLYLSWSSSAPTSLYKIYWPLFQRPLSHFFLLFMWIHLYLPHSSYSDCLCPVTWCIFPGHNHSPPTQVYIIWLIYLPKLRSYSSHFSLWQWCSGNLLCGVVSQLPSCIPFSASTVPNLQPQSQFQTVYIFVPQWEGPILSQLRKEGFPPS